MKVAFVQMIVLLALTSAAALLTYKFNPNAPALRLNEEPVGEGEVSIKEALGWEADGGVIWVDAREAEKYEKAHIPGAYLLNEFDFNNLIAESYDEIANQDQPLVVYCGSFRCKASELIAGKLREVGVSDVYTLKGGWDAWRDATGNK